MLDMRPGCEHCDKDLPADQDGAMICSFECTFCEGCTREKFKGTCPNCGGNLVKRPKRVGNALERHPASTTRIFNPKP